MKKITPFILLLAACTKEVKPPDSRPAGIATTFTPVIFTNIQKVQASVQFQQFTTGYNAMAAAEHPDLVTNAMITQANALAPNIRTVTDMNKWLSILKIDTTAYWASINTMWNALHSYQTVNHVTPQQTIDAFTPAIPKPDLASCRAVAIATAAGGTIACLALAATPVIGEVLAMPCANAVIALLTAQLVDCARNNKPPFVVHPPIVSPIFVVRTDTSVIHHLP